MNAQPGGGNDSRGDITTAANGSVMRDIELNFEQSEADRERLTIALFAAIGDAIDEDQRGTTYLTVDGVPVAIIAPYK